MAKFSTNSSEQNFAYFPTPLLCYMWALTASLDDLTSVGGSAWPPNTKYEIKSHIFMKSQETLMNFSNAMTFMDFVITERSL